MSNEATPNTEGATVGTSSPETQQPTPQGLAALPSEIRTAMESPEYQRGEREIVDRVTAYFQGVGAKETETGNTPNEYSGFETQGLDAEDRGELVAVAREAGLPSVDLQEVVKTFFEKTSSADRFKQYEPEATMAALTKEWGAETTLNLEVVQRFVSERAALGEWLERTQLGNNPALAVALFKLASRYESEGEDVDALMRSDEYRNENPATVQKVERAFARRYDNARVEPA